MALAEHLEIDGQHQRVALGGDGAVHQLFRKVAVADDVKLEPERFVGRLGDMLDRADRHGRQREGNAGVVGGARRQDLAVAVLHAAQADGRQDQRRRALLAEDGGREAAFGDVDQHALAQLDGFEVGAVGAQRVFAIGAAVGVFEKGFWHLAAGERAQVVDRGNVLHGPPGKGDKGEMVTGWEVAQRRTLRNARFEAIRALSRWGP